MQIKIRTNMLEVRNNYKAKYSKNKQDLGSKAPSDKDLLCPLCNKHLDNEENTVNATCFLLSFC